MLRRALEEGVDVRQLAGCGMWVAPSSRDAGTAYEETPWECECHAGQHGDPVCKHRAALRERLGALLLDDEPEPPTPAAPAAPPVCATGQDKRWVYKHNFYGAGYFRGPCPACVPSAFPLAPAT